MAALTNSHAPEMQPEVFIITPKVFPFLTLPYSVGIPGHPLTSQYRSIFRNPIQKGIYVLEIRLIPT